VNLGRAWVAMSAHSAVGTGKAVSQLHCAAFASLYSLDQRTGHPGYLVPVLCRWSASFARQLLQFDSFRPASSPSVCVSGRPWKLNASVLPSPLGRQSVASLVPAERKPNRRVCPHPFVTQPAHRPFERGDREPLTCAYTHTCVRVRLVYYDYTLTLL